MYKILNTFEHTGELNMKELFDPTLFQCKIDALKKEFGLISDIASGQYTYREMCKRNNVSLGYIAYFKDLHFPAWRIEQRKRLADIEKRKKRKQRLIEEKEQRRKRVIELRKYGHSYRKIAEETGLSLGTVSNIIRSYIEHKAG